MTKENGGQALQWSTAFAQCLELICIRVLTLCFGEYLDVEDKKKCLPSVKILHHYSSDILSRRSMIFLKLLTVYRIMEPDMTSPVLKKTKGILITS